MANILSKHSVAMDSPSFPRAPVLGFGVFELDCLAGELRKSGVLVHLPPQPFSVLALLASHPGQVIARADIRRQIWGDETFVDFEHGLNHCVNQIRTALGDDAETPRYIETLPRRGYRFIYPVTTDSVAASPGETVAPDGTDITGTGSAHRGEGRAHVYRFVGLAAVVIVLIVAAMMALNVARLRNRLLGVATGPPKIHSIAVLPLKNLSRDPDQEYFADGMTEELITTLGKIGTLRVISRTSVMRYKVTKKPLREIGRELNVDVVLEGATLYSGDRVRITVQLINARSDHQLWAATYERDLRDVLSLQDEVARDVASQISIKLTPNERTRLSGARPVNPEAHRLYLIGRFLWNERTEEGMKKAINNFRRAIQIYPAYARAYAGLADSYAQLSDWGFMRPRNAYQRSKAAAQRALEIDPSVAEAHTSLANAYCDYDWDWAAAEREFHRAIKLNPNYASAHQWYGAYLSRMGRRKKAIAECSKAGELDPLSAEAVGEASYALYNARRYDEAIRRLQSAFPLFLETADPYGLLGACYEMKGLDDKAFAAYQKAALIGGASSREAAAMGHAYAEGGMRGYYLWALGRMKARSRNTYVPPFEFARFYAKLGERNRAMAWLERAYQERNFGMIKLRVDPTFDPLRSDPRFQDLLRRMNFPKGHFTGLQGQLSARVGPQCHFDGKSANLPCEGDKGISRQVSSGTQSAASLRVTNHPGVGSSVIL